MFKFIKFVIYAIFFILEAIVNILTFKDFLIDNHYLTEVFIKNMNKFYDTVLFTDTVVFYGICFVISGISTLFLYKCNKLSFIENFFYKEKSDFFCSNNKKENIELIINNLLQNVSSYEAFYNYYTIDYCLNEEYIDNIFPYIDDVLLVLDDNAHLQSTVDIKMLDNFVSSRLNNFYKKSQVHLSKLEHWKEYEKTHDFTIYRKIGVPHTTKMEDRKSGIKTVIISEDFKNYMEGDYMPKVKQLTEEAQELINILRSKHIS